MGKKVVFQRALVAKSDRGSVTFFFRKTILPGVIDDGNGVIFRYIDARIEGVDTPLSDQRARFLFVSKSFILPILTSCVTNLP